MIMIDVLVQGTLPGDGASGGAFTLTPAPVFVNGVWQSFINVSENVLALGADATTVSHISDDNGATYRIASQDVLAFGAGTGLVEFRPRPTVALNNISALQQGINVTVKTGENDWSIFDMTAPPGASFVGGSFRDVTGDYANNLFIFFKGGSSGGLTDLFTSPDIVALTNPFPNVRNPINGPLVGGTSAMLYDVFGVYHMAGQYVAYGTDQIGGAALAVTSPDLVNWTKQVGVLPFFGLPTCFFNGAYFVMVDSTNIQRSVDGVTWASVVLPAIPHETVSQTRMGVLITSGRIEVTVGAYVLISLDGVTWTVEMLQNNLRPQGGVLTPGGAGLPIADLLAGAKGDLLNTATGPSHIALPVGRTLQVGGKVVHLDTVNAVPVLGYPLAHPGGDTVGWVQTDLNRDAVIENSYVINNIPASGTILCESLYARSSATTRYFEITVDLAGGTANRVGASALGNQHFLDVGLPATDAFFFHLENDLVTVSNTNDIAVVHTHTTGQIIGFLFDFVAQTCDITVDGVALVTVPNITDQAPWVAQSEIADGRFRINVGNEAFAHNTTLSAPWLAQ